MPDLDDPQDLVQAGRRGERAARRRASILAYHDRSDGGLFAAACEMAFAGHVGVALNVDLLVTEGDGISDSRAEYGDAKNWAGQVERAARGAHAQGAVQRRARRAAAGAHRRAQRGHADAARAWPVSAYSHFVGKTRPPASAIDAGKGEVAGLARRQGGLQRQPAATCTRCGTASAGRSAASATTRPAPTPNTPPPAIRTTRALHVLLAARRRARTWPRRS